MTRVASELIFSVLIVDRRAAMENPRRFVEDWNIIQTLGEGAYGEYVLEDFHFFRIHSVVCFRVKLLVHQHTNQMVALKVVDLTKHKDAADTVKKEEKIHSTAHHPNIIQLYGKREDGNKVYMFLEYASGGELFNKIGKVSLNISF